MALVLRENAYHVLECSEVPSDWSVSHEKPLSLILAAIELFKSDHVQFSADSLQKPEDLALIFFAHEPAVSEVIAAFQAGALDFITNDVLNRFRLLSSVSLALEKQYALNLRQTQLIALEQENQSLALRLNALKADQEAGHLVQLMLFPKTPCCFSTCQLSHKIIPSLWLSGDFIDYFAIDDEKVGFLLADVVGHGVSSAFITVLLKYVMNEMRNKESPSAGDILASPAKVLLRINHELLNMGLGKHVAMIYGVFDSKDAMLTFSVAAHYPLPILKNNGAARFIGGSSLPLGVFETLQVTHYTEKVGDDFALIMFSDGIMNVLPHDNLFTKEQYLLEMIDQGCIDTEVISSYLQLDSIENALDDIAVLVVRGS